MDSGPRRVFREDKSETFQSYRYKCRVNNNGTYIVQHSTAEELCRYMYIVHSYIWKILYYNKSEIRTFIVESYEQVHNISGSFGDTLQSNTVSVWPAEDKYST